jgi:guanylate kinase
LSGGLELRAQIEQCREQAQKNRMSPGTMTLSRRGMILILSSPSGAGKTTLTRMLTQDKALDLTLSVSVTTRPRRSSEVDGIHYRFVDPREFEHMKAEGDLLEWAEVHGNGYGTPRAPVEKVLAEGRDMLFDIDWQGASQVRERLGDDVVSIFVLPPSMRELRSRLERRAEDSATTIEKRLEAARHEIERWRNYHYVIVNDDLQRAYRDVLAIIAAERLKVRRVQASVEPFVESLVHG